MILHTAGQRLVLGKCVWAQKYLSREVETTFLLLPEAIGTRVVPVSTCTMPAMRGKLLSNWEEIWSIPQKRGAGARQRLKMECTIGVTWGTKLQCGSTECDGSLHICYGSLLVVPTEASCEPVTLLVQGPLHVEKGRKFGIQYIGPVPTAVSRRNIHVTVETLTYTSKVSYLL